ncbi:hypothetical protein MRX96_028180 [Rhipicephalus microplus]
MVLALPSASDPWRMLSTSDDSGSPRATMLAVQAHAKQKNRRHAQQASFRSFLNTRPELALARAAHSTSTIERLPRLRKQTDHLLQVIRPDTSTGPKTRRLVDVHCSTFSQESPSFKGYSLVSTNDLPKAAKVVVACPFNQCALGDVFPDTQDTESKRGDKVDQPLQCGLLYGKGSKQPIQRKRPKCPARSPEQHGAVERHRMAGDRKQSGSQHSKTRTSMSIALLGMTAHSLWSSVASAYRFWGGYLKPGLVHGLSPEAKVISPDTSTGTKTRRLVDVPGSTFSEESPSLEGPSLVAMNDVPEVTKDVVACPSNQCALEDVFPDTRDTEAKRGDKVDQLLQCGLLYGKGSKQPIQRKPRKCPRGSPEQHGAV